MIIVLVKKERDEAMEREREEEMGEGEGNYSMAYKMAKELKKLELASKYHKF